jgi:hypothetical protein
MPTTANRVLAPWRWKAFGLRQWLVADASKHARLTVRGHGPTTHGVATCRNCLLPARFASYEDNLGAARVSLTQAELDEIGNQSRSGSATIRSPGLGVVNFLTVLFTPSLLPLLSCEVTL